MGPFGMEVQTTTGTKRSLDDEICVYNQGDHLILNPTTTTHYLSPDLVLFITFVYACICHSYD